MNARLRDKQAAYLAAMGREAAEDPRGPTVVELRPPGTTDDDEVTIVYANGGEVQVRGKTTRQIVQAICRDLARTPAQVIATATKQGDFYSAWIKTNDGPAMGTEGGQRLAFVTGLTPTIINIVLGHPIDRMEQVMGRFYSLGSNQAQAARAEAAAKAKAKHGGGETPAAEPEAVEVLDPAEDETFPEPELAGDDE